MDLNLDGTNIILTGFMGTGKSTVGKLLAERLRYEFVDTDVLIQERHGLTIPQIFSQRGEESFRQMEREVAAELAQQRRLVISTGGRMMLDPDNVASLGCGGRIFCLTAAPAEILARVAKDDTGIPRPLLGGDDPAQRIEELLAERARGYRRFPQIETDGKAPAAVVDEVLAALERTG